MTAALREITMNSIKTSSMLFVLSVLCITNTQAQTFTSPEFAVNTTVAGDQMLPSVAALPGGGFIAAWDSENQDGSLSGIIVQRFTANGSKLGSEFVVNEYGNERQSNPAIASDGQGRFLVAWNSATHTADSTGVFARRFGANGAPLGASFRVNTSGRDIYAVVAVAMNASGQAVIVWPERSSTGLPVATNSAYSHIVAQRYAADGSALGAPITVATSLLTNFRTPGVGIDDNGGFVVSWNSDLQSGFVSENSSLGLGLGVFARRYGADGKPLAAQFQVDTGAANLIVDRPVVAVAADGRFALAWQTNSAADLSPQGVQLRRYAANGKAVETPFKPDSATMLRRPALSYGADGRLLVSAYSAGIYLRGYASSGAALGASQRVDEGAAGNAVQLPGLAQTQGGAALVWQSFGQDGSGRGIRARLIAP